MKRLFNLIVLMSLGLSFPLMAMAPDWNIGHDLKDEEDVDLKNLEEELRRLLEESDNLEIEEPSFKTRKPSFSEEEETLIIPSAEGDVQKLALEYKDPMDETVKALPFEEEEVIILDEDENDDLENEAEIL